MLFSSVPGMSRYLSHPLGIAAVQYGNISFINERGGFSAPVGMNLLALCASFPDRAITLPAEVLAALGIANPQLTLTPYSGALGQYPVLWLLNTPPRTLFGEKQPFLLPERPVCS